MANELGYGQTFLRGAGFAYGLGLSDIGEGNREFNSFLFKREAGKTWQGALRSRSIKELRQGLPYKYSGSIFTGAGKATYLGGATGLKAVGKYVGGTFGAILGPGVLALGAYHGYKEGGVFGAAKHMAIDTVLWGVGDVVGKVGMQAVANPITGPILVAGALLAASQGIGAYRAWGSVQKDVQARYRSLPIGMAGDMSAFNTGSAATMRQRSERAIMGARSSMSLRSGLGTESMLYHHGARY